MPLVVLAHPSADRRSDEHRYHQIRCQVRGGWVGRLELTTWRRIQPSPWLPGGLPRIAGDVGTVAGPKDGLRGSSRLDSSR